jgi:hypothetical protein
MDIVRSCFEGPSAPPNPVTGNLWGDTTSNTMKRWDGSAWQVLGPRMTYPRASVTAVLSAVSATGTLYLVAPTAAFVLTKLSLVSQTTTVSDATNKWTFQVRDVANSVNLFATAPTTNGAELTANTRRDYTPDQNTVRPVGSVLEFQFTKGGTATTMAQLLVQLDGYWAA